MSTNDNYINYLIILGGIMVACIVLGFLFKAINSAGLQEKSGNVPVTKKEYFPVKEEFVHYTVNNQPRMNKVEKYDVYVVTVDIDGKDATCNVDKSTYDNLAIGDPIQVTYKKKRITGAVDITQPNYQ